MTRRPFHETFVHNAADLTRLWTELMGPDGFGRRSLWHIFFEPDGRLSPVIIPVDDVPDEPEGDTIDSICSIMRDGMEQADLTSLAVLLSRPGHSAMTESDRRWARTVVAIYGAKVRLWPMHLATHGQVRVFAPDDLIAA